VNPGLIYVSASGLGRTGPESQAVAYGTLLQCYAGFAGLNRHPGVSPRVGMAWLDPMCGLMLAFITTASLWRRRQSGSVARVDFSMVEAMLWTMAEPLLAEQLGEKPAEPKGRVYRQDGADEWLSVETAAGDSATATLARSADLVASEHLRARGFWDAYAKGVLPGLPWQASFGRAVGLAPGLGPDTDAVLHDVLAMPAAEIRRLRENGALG
jgi:crotonobetainyl-CoA:carnitine CoA-transferase CaiB-like acyl-CoA transferase